jgi:NADH-quinone oxidoreductase subunit E
MAKSTDGIAYDENPPEMERKLAEIRNEFEGKREELIPMLQKVQAALGYLPEKALLEIARWSKLPPAAVFGAATFYTQFRFHPTGKHTLRICRGTACHVKGSDRILNDIESFLDIGPGETSQDHTFTLETVACFGSCALAPVVLIDSAVKGRMSASKTREVIQKIQEKEDHFKR